MKLSDLIVEGLAADAFRITDYLNSLKDTSMEVKKQMKDLCLQLLKKGFIFPENHNPRLNKDEDDMAGFGFSFILPEAKDRHSRVGILTIMYTTFKEKSNGQMAFHKWTSHYSAKEILDMGLDEFMDHTRKSARPVRSNK